MTEKGPDPSPRQRTLKRLGCLSAAAGVALGSAYCGVRGYGVVDPMPSPARCPGLAATVRASASWTSIDTVTVILEAPRAMDAAYVVDAHPGAGPELVSWEIKSSHAELVFRPPPEQTQLRFWIAVNCSPASIGPGTERLQGTVELGERPRVDGGAAIGPPALTSPALIVNLADSP